MTTSRMRGLIACATAACALLIALPGAALAADPTWSSTGPVQVSAIGPILIKGGGNTYACESSGEGTTWGADSSVQNASYPTSGGVPVWAGLDYQSFSCRRGGGGGALILIQPYPWLRAVKNGSVFSVSGSSAMHFSGTAFITPGVPPLMNYTAPWTNGTSAAAPSKVTFLNTPVSKDLYGNTITLTATIIVRTATGGLLTLS